MIQAIEEMRLSRSEHFNKADPLVGAVLVDRAGRVLARAHRGNFSGGDHAELTPISRRLRPELIAPLTERQRKILDVMNEKGSITSSEVTRQWGITRETAATDFHKLIELGLVERKGIGRSTYYVLRPM